MTEKNYRVQKFADWAPALSGHRVALYGTAANAAALLDAYPEFPFLCLIDRQGAGRYLYGKVVVTLEEAAALDIDVIILAAQISSAAAIYDRISLFCHSHGIRVYDMYGCDLHQTYRKLLTQKIAFPQMDAEKLYERCRDFPVVSFGCLDTLMSRTIGDTNDFFQLVEETAEKEGVHGNLKALRQDGNFIYMRSDAIYARIAARMDLSNEKATRLEQMEFELELRCALPRPPMVALLNRLVEEGKSVYVVSDLPWAEDRLCVLLRQLGCSEAVRCIPRDANVGKVNGSYRTLMEREPGQKILHIGANDLEDFVAASVYGLEVAWIPSAFSLMQSSTFRVVGPQIETTENRRIVGDFCSHTYADPFSLQHGNQNVQPDSARLLMMAKVRGTGAQQQVVITQRPELLPSFEVGDESAIARLTVPAFENPRVSVVIPVYNQFVYTYNCIRSIIENSGDVSYEILIADDCSTDQVARLEQFVEGAVVVHNQQNLRFLRNCNHAAEQAKGEFILFLNNDTQVQKDWLAPLVALMDRDETIGMVGSKLIYPDGYLQEAGGIVWNDASAWNYGHRKDPQDCEYNYVREVDYISGAAIMIRADLWREIGGFDERFAPAYYEDTDLAFEVRKHGKKVMYQPQSVVVHFEGVSNGTDLTSGQKAYQVANREKFYQKWQDVLRREHYPNGENVFCAKGRTRFRKHILVVDHYVPNYDKDAGGKCTYMYMKTFVKMGLEVTFIGDNFACLQPYTAELQQLGIHVIYGDYYAINKDFWLMENLPSFEYIYLQRPHISIKYIDLVRQFGRGKVFYFAHDLAHIREMREYKITGDPSMLASAEKWKKIEYELFDKCDVGHVVGSYEQGIMQKAFPNKPVRNIPVYVYDALPAGINKDFATRKDLMFVGGFGHRPNGDAVKWFAREVFPTVLQKYPDIKWYIIGSRVPDDILQLQSEHIIVTGFMPDEDLERMYRTCRMAVVPLRYGAGVKGKVIESAYYQIPLVTTPIGAEGLVCDNGVFAIEETAEGMAERICALYEDFDALREMSDKGKQFIENGFTLAAAEALLRQDMDE